MNQHYRDTRKIDPARGAELGDGSPNDNDRIEIGPTQLAFREWEAAGLELPDLAQMRHYRWQRLTDHITARDWGGLLVFDPLNIRYATDSTNMQLWNTHNPFRALLICADGHMVLWDYKNSPFLSEFNPLVREVRSGADFFYFDRGDKIDVAAGKFAAEIRDLIAEHGGRQHAPWRRQDHAARAARARGGGVCGDGGRGMHREGAVGQRPRRDPRHALRPPRLRDGGAGDGGFRPRQGAGWQCLGR